MAVKKYSDLVRGYILQEGDKLLCIHGCGECKVAKKIENSKVLYYLNNVYLTSSYLYKKLRLDEPDGFESIEELTKHVIKLYETPCFKIGDKVKVTIKHGKKYPFPITTYMEGMSSKIYTISKSIFIDPTTYHEDEPMLMGEFFKYTFKEDPYSSFFHPIMFDLVKSSMKRELSDGELVVIGGYILRVCNSNGNGWFLADARELLTEAGIIHNIRELFKEHDITVVRDGTFPFVKTNEDLLKAYNLIKFIIENKQKEKPEIQTSKKSMKDIITIDTHNQVNTDIIL